MMRIASSVAAALTVWALVGCSSGTGGGLEAPPPAAEGGAEANPYGAPYPATDLGFQARAGAAAGNRIRNYRFVGYRTPGSGEPTATVSLADFYDPEGRTHKVIHLVASSVWCGPCNQETRALSAATARFQGKGIVVVQALIDGPVQGRAASTADLDGWITRHGLTFPTVLDPDVRNLGQFFNAAAVPWNAIIDARSMEILQAEVGAVANIDGLVAPWVQWVATNPPKP